VGLVCESASVRQVARQFGLAASTVRAIDLRYLQRWSVTRHKDPLAQMGVDEIYFGKQMKFITVVSNVETGEPLWFGPDRKQETLDEFFRIQLTESQRGSLRGYVATVHQQHCPMGAELPDGVRQIPRSATRQQSHQ
jgi:transposase